MAATSKLCRLERQRNAVEQHTITPTRDQRKRTPMERARRTIPKHALLPPIDEHTTCLGHTTASAVKVT